MERIRPEDLEKISEKVKDKLVLREGKGSAKIIVHMGTCGIAAGARTIMNALMRCMDESAVKDVIFSTSGCAGLCSREPMITIELAGHAPVKYVDLTEDKAKRIFAEHIVKGEIVVDYALAIGSEQTP